MFLLKSKGPNVGRNHPGKEMFEKYYHHFLGSDKEGRGPLRGRKDWWKECGGRSYLAGCRPPRCGQPSTRVTEVGVASRWDPWHTRGGASRQPGPPKKTWREAPSWGNRAKCGEADGKSAEGETACCIPSSPMATSYQGTDFLSICSCWKHVTHLLCKAILKCCLW